MLCGDLIIGEVKCFLIGFIVCEIMGLIFSFDYKIMFVGVQYLGEEVVLLYFFYGGISKFCLIIMMIICEDGGVIGV